MTRTIDADVIRATGRDSVQVGGKNTPLQTPVRYRLQDLLSDSLEQTIPLFNTLNSIVVSSSKGYFYIKENPKTN